MVLFYIMMTSMKKIVITGAGGMLGTALIQYFSKKHHVFATDMNIGFEPEGVVWDVFDLTDTDKLEKYFIKIQPDFIIHCAAVVNVDYCEKNPDYARLINVFTTQEVSRISNVINASLIYISTDSVFNGRKHCKYIETDDVHPLNIYARTKFEGENIILKSHKNVVLRTNIFGWSRNENLSFAEWVLKGLVLKERLTMFTDVIFTPIHVFHLAEVIDKIISKRVSGLFHAAGSTSLSKYDFAIRLAQYFELNKEGIVKTSVDSLDLTASRPKNMALDNSKLCNALDWQLPGIDDGILIQKQLYKNGWLSEIKGRITKSDYRFWEIV